MHILNVKILFRVIKCEFKNIISKALNFQFNYFIFARPKILTELKKLPNAIEGHKRQNISPGKKVRIRYDSKGHNITKHLFGNRPWIEKKFGKIYNRKAVPGILNGTPAYKCGNACVIVPLEMEESVKTSIRKEGGTIKSVTPITLTKEESKEMVKTFQINYFKTLEGLITQASTVEQQKDFEDCLARSIILTKKFKSHLKEVLEYTEEEQKAIETADKVFQGLQSISKEDLATAKIEAQFIAKNLEREYNELVKSSNK